MFITKNFRQDNIEQLRSLICSYPFATFITHTKDQLEVNHLPFYLHQSNGKDRLQGHIARANPLWKNLKEQSEVLVIFQGPHCYISPSYYPSKKETGKVVPTWNYVVVQVKGSITFIEDKAWKIDMLNRLTDQHETKQVDPWSVADAPDEYTQRLLHAIVGIEVEVSSMIGKWKVSQNQSEENKQGVINHLSESDEVHAQAMASFVESFN
ncbi:FMN-binding negative transcriptional regulator [Marinomonas agarivorans]|nr:FMN-binding negative transcriptional regulator [Marinomonas agarivorans]